MSSREEVRERLDMSCGGRVLPHSHQMSEAMLIRAKNICFHHTTPSKKSEQATIMHVLNKESWQHSRHRPLDMRVKILNLSTGYSL